MSLEEFQKVYNKFEKACQDCVNFKETVVLSQDIFIKHFFTDINKYNAELRQAALILCKESDSAFRNSMQTRKIIVENLIKCIDTFLEFSSFFDAVIYEFKESCKMIEEKLEPERKKFQEECQKIREQIFKVNPYHCVSENEAGYKSD